MWFGVLGPLLVRSDDGLEVDVGPRQRRMLLCRLLVDANRVVSSDQLIDALWGEDAPQSASGSLQVHISRLRGKLGDRAVQTRPPGYLLRVGPDSFDRDVFERLLIEARRDTADGALATASSRLNDALGLWRGTAFSDIADEPWALVEVRRLEELRVSAHEDQIEIDLRLGRHNEIVSDLETLVAGHPLRERLWRLLMLAYYQGGRQAEALRAYRRAKEVLAEELGIDPSVELQELETDILNQDPRLVPETRKPRSAVTAEWRSSQTLTLLMTDIEGSTSLWEREGEAMREALPDHDALLTAAIEGADGRIVKHLGDGMLALFPSANQAVRAALNAQRDLQHVMISEEPIRVRMAIHSGEGWEKGGDLFGPLPNLCARLAGAAHGGQIVMSAIAAGLAQPTLAPGVQLTDLGRIRLPGVTQPQQVFQISASGLRERFPPLRALGVAQTNLPAQLTTFVGRDLELRLVGKTLQEHRLVTITGPGGCGKTRLALQAAADAVPQSPDGVWYVQLAASTEPAGLWPEIARVLGVAEDEEDVEGAVMHKLDQTRMLIILDNCEHLIDQAAETTSKLLTTVEGLTVLATSREPLAVPGEQLIPLSGMAIPDAGMQLAELAGVESIRLFRERAQAVLPDFAVTSDTAASVVEICRRVDGLPLAVELASAHVRDMTPAAIAKSLTAHLDVLSSHMRTIAPRHRTLDAAMSWSYDGLDRRLQALYRRLSVFAGSWLLEAAEEVCPDGEVLMGQDVAELVALLVDKSLVIFDSSADPPLYFQLGVVRQHAAKRLDDEGETHSTMIRLALYIKRLVEAVDGFQGPDQERWLSRFDIEANNLANALRWATENALPVALAIASDCYFYWVIRSRIQLGRQLIEPVVAAAPEEPTRDLAASLAAAGGLALMQGDPVGESFYLRAVDVYRRIGDMGGVAAVLVNLAIVAEDRSDLVSARNLLSEALELLDSIDDPTNRGVSRKAGALTNLGSVTLAMGDVDASFSCATEAARLSRSIDDKWSEAWALILAALAGRNLPDGVMEAESQGREALAIAHRLDDAITAATAAETLAEIALVDRRPAEAIRWLTEALPVREELRDGVRVASGRTMWAKALLALGDHEHACQQLVLALDETLSGGHRFEAATALEVAAALFAEGPSQSIANTAIASAREIRQALKRPVLPADQPFIQAIETQLDPVQENNSPWTEVVTTVIGELQRVGKAMPVS